jgi:magnesium transporter
MTKTLKETLKEIQISLGKPHRRIVGVLKYYLGFLNVSEDVETLKKEPKLEKIQIIRHKKITWVDVRNPNRKAISELAQEYPFHPLHLEDCISKGQFPKIEENLEDKYLFMLFRFPRYSNEGVITINQICFFLGEKYLVTVHENTSDAISQIFNDCLENEEERHAYIDNSPSHLLYTIMEGLSDDLAPLSQKILTEVDTAEDIVFDDKISAFYQIGQLRRKIISLRRVLGPLRVLLSDMTTRINAFSESDLTVYFEDILHRVEKAWETLEEARETVDIYKDADFIYSTEKTNRILAVLTIIFTLSIPATVIGTFYGMNIVLPGGLEVGPWEFFGRYSTFTTILIAAATPALVMVWYFRKRGWF